MNRRHSILLLPAVSILLAVLLSCPVMAQEEQEYNMELGVMGGGSFYMGDANVTNPFGNPAPCLALLARYNINPHMVVKGDLAMGRVVGTTVGQANRYPGGAEADFNRPYGEFAAQFEYNFHAYGTGGGYKDSHRFTPYLLAGAGLVFAPRVAKAQPGADGTSQNVGNVFALDIPVGVGVKYKLAPRLNVGAEWTFRFTSTDKLDVSNPDGLQLNNPYNIIGTGLKNKDTISFLVAYISYDLFAKKCDCND